MDKLILQWQEHMSGHADIFQRDKEYYVSSDEIDVKLKNHIVANKLHFTDKIVVDIGCNNGFWLLQFYLHGAKEVIGIEPRKALVDMFNNFAQQHDLPCKMIQGFHPKVFELQHIDCVSMMSVDEEMPDFDNFLYRLGCAYPGCSLLVQSMLIDVPVPNPYESTGFNPVNFPEFKGVVYKFELKNHDHRDGFDPRQSVTDDIGNQDMKNADASYIHNIYSKDYMHYILQREGFNVLAMKKIQTQIKRPMTQTGKSGLLWWITAQNSNMTQKEPVNLFEYKTK